LESRRQKETRRERGERSQSSDRLLPWWTVSSHQLDKPLRRMWMYWTRLAKYEAAYVLKKESMRRRR
jgi:hypothetical protein